MARITVDFDRIFADTLYLKGLLLIGPVDFGMLLAYLHSRSDIEVGIKLLLVVAGLRCSELSQKGYTESEKTARRQVLRAQSALPYPSSYRPNVTSILSGFPTSSTSFTYLSSM